MCLFSTSWFVFRLKYPWKVMILHFTTVNSSYYRASRTEIRYSFESLFLGLFAFAFVWNRDVTYIRRETSDKTRNYMYLISPECWGEGNRSVASQYDKFCHIKYIPVKPNEYLVAATLVYIFTSFPIERRKLNLNGIITTGGTGTSYKM